VRTAFEKYRQDTDLQFRYWQAVLQSQIEEAKIVGEATKGLIEQREEGNEQQASRANGASPRVGNGETET